MCTITRVDEDGYRSVNNGNTSYKYCKNSQHGACNWLIPIESSEEFCKACKQNRTIPTLSYGGNLENWRKIEVAKHRLIYSLVKLGLPVHPRNNEDTRGFIFDFKADTPDEKVMTGHKNGVITLNINEADEVIRVRHKNNLGEGYRTVLGHLRHEIGHYYWDLLIKDSIYIDEFRQLFGDERADYGQALNYYYQNKIPSNWKSNYISPYASSHPWEDWAETWAHYLHLMDTIETAHAFGIDISPSSIVSGEDLTASIWKDPYDLENFDDILKMWQPLTYAINSLNRSMGHQDFYPFIITPKVRTKLAFIHSLSSNGKPVEESLDLTEEPKSSEN